MSPFPMIATLGLLASSPSFAESGDVTNGARVFKRCQACHLVMDDTGETLAGRVAGAGPNLYRVAGRPAASVEGFRYSQSLSTAGETGLTWDAQSFVSYVKNPTEFLRGYLSDASVRSNMGFRLRSEAEARDVYAYLQSLSD